MKFPPVGRGGEKWQAGSAFESGIKNDYWGLMSETRDRERGDREEE